MTLRTLLDDGNVPPVPVGGLCADSRQVKPGDAFVACRGGTFDGHDHATAAVAAGAAAVLSERAVEVAAPNVVVADLKARVPGLASRAYGNPSAALDVAGVTGTNGKTTVAHTVASVTGGGYIGTLGWGRPPRLCPSALTTPDAVALQARLRRLAADGAGTVALEASSHALHQGRVDAVRFRVAAFTNLSRDHLDYHGSLDRYGAAKRRLFERPLDAAVVNADDAVGRAIGRAAKRTTRVVAYGRNAELSWSDVAYRRIGLEGVWHTPWGRRRFVLPAAFGEFSLYNAAAALAICCVLEVPLADAVDAMRGLPGLPGRMQRVCERPAVIVDYAHTPEALRVALAAVRAHAGGGRVIVLFGCGGDRDRGKRPQMAAVAEAGADAVVLTSDNPRHEDPEAILDDAAAGFARPNAARRIADRRAAIAAAVGMAEPGDSVLLAGKGHETVQIVGDERRPFDDAAAAREAAGVPPRVSAPEQEDG